MKAPSCRFLLETLPCRYIFRGQSPGMTMWMVLSLQNWLTRIEMLWSRLKRITLTYGNTETSPPMMQGNLVLDDNYSQQYGNTRYFLLSPNITFYTTKLFPSKCILIKSGISTSCQILLYAISSYIEICLCTALLIRIIVNDCEWK